MAKEKKYIDTETHIYVKQQKNSKNGFNGYQIKRVPRATAEQQLDLPVEERNHHWKTISRLADEDPQFNLQSIPGADALIEKKAKEMAEKMIAAKADPKPEKEKKDPKPEKE